MKVELVSFAMCPYVQRAAIGLQEKNVPYEVRYIDLADKPAWFLEISPRGKVPVLIVDGTPIFESSAICEYLDEVCPPPRLFSDDPLLRARERGWFQFAEDVLAPIKQRMLTTDQKIYDAAAEALTRALSRLEPELAGREFLSGDGTRFGMADVAIAPAFTRIEILRELGGYSIPTELSNVRALSDRLLARESVKRSVPDDLMEVTVRRTKRLGALVVAS